MKKMIPILMALILATSIAYAHGGKKYKNCDFNWNSYTMDNIEIDLEESTIILTPCHQSKPKVEITEEYELYINGKLIETDARQKELIGEYYRTTMELVEKAKEIGIKGAKIGVEGAKLGLGSLASLVKLLRSDYDTDDFEKEIEAKAEKIEKKAELLEEEAEELEDLAYEMEDLYEQMEDEISELDELDWY